ncbi:CHC2 zinc finger domain-containing protein [Microvirga sp. RSM25]|uniref:DUF7146 domain-containing protein n=1 Tax=Microvirga sp. RSM25 TaxID=3273802 RepID=UPI00384E0DA1
MARASNPELERWMEEARRTPITVLLDHPAMSKLRGGVDKSGPCPRCRDGKDRFSVHTRKNVWNCRVCQMGGDVIELCEILEGCDFFTACEILNHRPPPGRTAHESPERRELREREVQEWRAKIAQDEARKAQDEADYRERERKRCWDFWSAAKPIAGTTADAYLGHRKLKRPDGALLRFAPRHPLFGQVGKGAKPVHVGPAMLAAIIGPDGRFAGLHATWIDLTTESGKGLVPDPETGEFVPAKKVRGSQRGGRIELVRVKNPRRLFVGEGIETVLSVWTALQLLNSPLLEGAAFWSSINLLNLGGKATTSVRHPTLRKTDRRGRSYPTMVPSAVPDFSSDIMPVPDSVEELFLLGDGDSEPEFTRNALLRAALRHERPGRIIREAWADTGTDFNSMLRGQAA